MLEYSTASQAQMISKATRVDDPEFVKTKVKGKQLHATISTDSVSSLLHTIDDYLACVTVSETIVDKN